MKISYLLWLHARKQLNISVLCHWAGNLPHYTANDLIDEYSKVSEQAINRLTHMALLDVIAWLSAIGGFTWVLWITTTLNIILTIAIFRPAMRTHELRPLMLLLCKDYGVLSRLKFFACAPKASWPIYRRHAEQMLREEARSLSEDQFLERYAELRCFDLTDADLASYTEAPTRV
jgi:hypothetical protein